MRKRTVKQRAMRGRVNRAAKFSTRWIPAAFPPAEIWLRDGTVVRLGTTEIQIGYGGNPVSDGDALPV